MTVSQGNGAGMNDEMLMAYVDGELGPEEAQAVERAAAVDAELARRIAVHRRTRQAAQAAFAGLLHAQPPERLTAALRPATARRHFGTLASTRIGLPLAASLVLAVALGSFFAGRTTAPDDGSLAARAGSPAMMAALAHQPSGVPVEVEGTRLTATGTYPAGNGLCRSFTLETEGEALRGVACNSGEGWKTGLVAAAPKGEAAQTASGTAAAAVESYLDAAGAGPALDPAEEVRQLGR